MKPLGEALDEVAKWSEKPVWRSDAVGKRADEPVALVDDHKAPLRETLELLERIQHLHITVEPLRLRVETDEDWRDRNRRLVNLSLRDYGVFFHSRDFPARQLGYNAGGGGQGGINMFANASEHHANCHGLISNAVQHERSAGCRQELAVRAVTVRGRPAAWPSTVASAV